MVPFSAQIEAATGITLLPHGPLREIDLHMLPLDGQPLLAQRPVRYSLDLPPRIEIPPARAAVMTCPST